MSEDDVLNILVSAITKTCGLIVFKLHWLRNVLINCNVHRSANTRFHSTETSRLTMQNYISTSKDPGKVVALTLLDLSIAFNIIDDTILRDCLNDWFGFNSHVLMWVNAYLNNHK